MKTKTILTVLFLLAMSQCVQGQRVQMGKLSPMLRHLVRQQQPSGARLSRPDARPVVAFVQASGDGSALLRRHGCTELLRRDDLYIASIPLWRLPALSAESQVAAIEANMSLSHRGGQQALNDQMAHHLDALRAYAGEGLPQAFTGRGVMMGVMDIGFDLTHPTFFTADTTRYRITALWDQLSPDTVGSPLYVGRQYVGRQELLSLGCCADGRMFSHGTHTVGTAAGSGYDSPYRGMAPEADICLVANATTGDIALIDSADYYKYTFATDALGFAYIFDRAEALGMPCVISFSEGSGQDFYGYDRLYYTMLERLVGPGRILVASAGNQGYVKSWFEKPVGVESAGTFIRGTGSSMTVTMRSADAFDMRLVGYAGERRDTLCFDTRRVLAAADSVLTDTVALTGGATLVAQVEAYTSCYDEADVCYDLTLQTTGDEVGYRTRLSLEVMGRDAYVDCWRVNGAWRTNDLNPRLCAGDSTHNVHSPSSAPCVISVGATTYRDTLVNLWGDSLHAFGGTGGVRLVASSVGPTMDGRIKPDVMAPGNNIISAYSSFYIENNAEAEDTALTVSYFDFSGRRYAWTSNSGTSMAAPAVGGAIALWLQARPTLTPAEALAVIARTSRRYDPSMHYPNNEYGHGEIDVYAGLLDLLGLSTVETVSASRTRARIECRRGSLHIGMAAPPTRPWRLRLFGLSGKCVADVRLGAGQTSYDVALPALPAGVYALQMDGEAQLSGSQLVRIDR